MGQETRQGPNANTAYLWISIAGAAGAAFIATVGGRFNVGWALTAMVAAPAIMAFGIVLLISRAR